MAVLPHLAIAPVRGKIYASIFPATTLYCAVVAFQRARACLNELQNACILSRPSKMRFVIDFLPMRKLGSASLPEIWPAQV
jgi:hypothetical protein